MSEILRESGPLNSLIPCTGLLEPECWAVMLLDGLDESLDLDGGVGLGKVGIGIALGHGDVPDWLTAYQVGALCTF